MLKTKSEIKIAVVIGPEGGLEEKDVEEEPDSLSECMKEAGESITECAEEIKETVKEAVKESVEKAAEKVDDIGKEFTEE